MDLGYVVVMKDTAFHSELSSRSRTFRSKPEIAEFIKKRKQSPALNQATSSAEIQVHVCEILLHFCINTYQ